MRPRVLPLAELRSIGGSAWLFILALPVASLIAGFILRDHAGPFWLWSNLDPDYWYLLDSLNLINLNWPVHIAHPGTPLQVFGAVLIKLAHPFSSSAEITERVLSAPETYLHLIHTGLVFLNSAALGFIGLCGYLVFTDRVAIVLLQLGPFVSKLNIKWMTHVAPEPLLIIVVLILAGVSLLALRPGQMEENRDRYAVIFGIIAGFGMATKITSIGIYFLPIVLLWNARSLAVYAIAGLLSIVIFTLPAAGSYADILGHINNISVGSQTLGEVKKPFIDFTEYPAQLVRISSRPIFFVVLFASLLMVGYLGYRTKAMSEPFPITGRLMAGLCIAFIVQALVVAKHPSGHYMIPVLVLGTLGITLLYRQLVDICSASGAGRRRVTAFFALLCVGLVIAQTLTLVKLDRQFQERANVATDLNDDRFAKCARIFFWSAASPSYALQLGNDMVGNPFSENLRKLRPNNDFWFEVVSKEFRDWQSVRDVREIANHYPCIYARGLYPNRILPELNRLLPHRTFVRACSPKGGHETILTSGVDCQGTIQ